MSLEAIYENFMQDLNGVKNVKEFFLKNLKEKYFGIFVDNYASKNRYKLVKAPEKLPEYVIKF